MRFSLLLLLFSYWSPKSQTTAVAVAARVVLKSYSSAARLCTSVKYQKVYSPWISNSICSRAPLVFGVGWRLTINRCKPPHSLEYIKKRVTSIRKKVIPQGSIRIVVVGENPQSYRLQWLLYSRGVNQLALWLERMNRPPPSKVHGHNRLAYSKFLATCVYIGKGPCIRE